MDWDEAVDLAEPSSMRRDDLLELISRRLDIMWGIREEKVNLKQDLWFIYVVLYRILSGGGDYDPQTRVPKGYVVAGEGAIRKSDGVDI